MNIIGRIYRRLSFKYHVIAAKRKRKNSTCIKWGIIGLGNMANQFANALQCVPEAEIVAAGSRNLSKAQSFCKKYSVLHAYGSYSEMLADKSNCLEVVYISTPHFEHYNTVKLALENKVNVICEKPFVETENQLIELVEIAKKNDCFLMEGLWSYCLPTYQIASEWIKEGIIGEINKIEVDLSRVEHIDSNRSAYQPSLCGGVLNDFGIYPVSFFSRFVGNEYTVLAYKKKVNEDGLDIDWDIKMTSDNIKGHITISGIKQGNQNAVIFGTKGRIEFGTPFNRTNSVKLVDNSGKMICSKKFNYLYQGFEYEIREVNNSLINGAKESSIIPIGSSMKNVHIMEKLMRLDAN